MLTTPIAWLIFGSILCLMELIFPTAFVAFMMGISAIIVSGIAILIPNTNIQMILWLISSSILIFLARKFLTPKRKHYHLQDAEEGETLTEITPSQPGRVMYEGNSWRAICADATTTISPHETVYIVSRKGNTLLVLPTNILKQ
jgi:membrane protein implicated in regulation of membrane protease activity